LKNLAESEGLKNIVLKTGKAEDIILCQACADIAFLGTVLHDFNDPLLVLQNARKMIKKDGHLINLDWKKKEMEKGPPVQKRFSEERASRLIEKSGFSIEEIKDNGLYHYLITAKPK
jgi:ubiquinone/menaquinone biosynthesis C-methylase UbiE